MWPILALLGLLAAAVEGFLLYKAIRNTRRAQLIARLPWSELGRLQEGWVKVAGRVAPTDGLFHSPLGNRACVYFHFIVQEKRQRSGPPPHAGSTYWKTIIDDAQFLPFVLDDGTGQLAVHLQAAELVLDAGAVERSGFLNDARPELEAALQEYGHSSIGLVFNRTLWYNEKRIEEGDALVAVGVAAKSAAGTWELQPRPLIVSNLGEAGLRASFRNAALGSWLAVVLLAGLLSGAAFLALA